MLKSNPKKLKYSEIPDSSIERAINVIKEIIQSSLKPNTTAIADSLGIHRKTAKKWIDQLQININFNPKKKAIYSQEWQCLQN